MSYITREYLKNNSDKIFVFGDNTIRKGTGGAAKLRYCENTYGFLTKKFPNNSDDSFYKLDEYLEIYLIEIEKLKKKIKDNPDKTFLISKLGAGLANRYKIFENIIDPRIKRDLKDYPNVEFLW